MTGESPTNGALPVAETAIRAALEQILASPNFRQAARASRLLRYLTEQTLAGHAGELKEYVVGVEVFDKRSSFDPRSDSSVRVEVARLRSRLQSYYSSEGRGDACRLSIPKGAYSVVCQMQDEPGREAPRWWQLSGWRIAVAGLGLVIGLGLLGWLLYPRLSRPSPLSLAVLPFSNLSGDPAAEYLADGFSDELTAALGSNPSLHVVARTSAFHFKGAREDVRQIAAQLRVGTILEGSLQKGTHPDHVVVTAQLIDGATGYHIWSQTYERESGGVRAVVDQIGEAVRQALKAGAVAPRKARATAEIESLYFQGVYLRGRSDEASRERGMQMLLQAVEKDPQFAPAQAALAMIFASRSYHGFGSRQQAAAGARTAARAALAAEESNAKAHAALGWVSWFHDREWVPAETELRRAIELNQSYATAHNLLSLALTTRGRFDEAMAEAQRARELDPINFLVSTDLGLAAYCARRYDHAIELARAVQKVEPGFVFAQELIGICLGAKGRWAESVGELRAAGEKLDSPESWGRLGYSLGRRGDTAAARQVLERISRSSGQPTGRAFSDALVYTGLGEAGAALQSLEKSADEHDASVMFLAVDPAFDSLREQPRFQSLLERLNLR